MRRKKYLLVAVIAVFFIGFVNLLTSCDAIVRGNGDVITEDRSVSSFDAIRVSGSFEIFLEQGTSESLRIEADENLMDIIKTEVRSGILTIYTQGNIIHAESMKVYITFVNIDDIDISGAVELTGKGMLSFSDIDIEASGAAEIDLNLQADDLEIDLSGSTEVDLAGKASKMSLEVSGAAELFAEDFELERCDISISGAGSAIVNVRDELDVDISGAASVRYKGQPRVSQNVSGAGKIRSIE